jgi:hypothetical protein
MNSLRLCPLILLLFPSCMHPLGLQQEPSPWLNEVGSFAEHVLNAERQAGLFWTWVDRERGKLFIELPAPQTTDEGKQLLAECLYVEGLTSGLGSNDVGLDRGQVGATRVLQFRELAGQLLLEVPNLAFRALSSDSDERQATVQSFATSVLWSTPILAVDEQGNRLVDMTGFLVRDAHGSARKLGSAGGKWSLDDKRSYLLASQSLCFPDNLELEALLTFAGSSPGREVREVAPVADSVTMTQHHSFIRLPDAGYEPLPWDPRAGGFSTAFTNTSALPTEPNRVQYAVRHRLAKKDPTAIIGEAIEPIVYYVDRGAPEPVRSALIEGASWWDTAFDAAGYRDAFRVELLPAGVHLLDIRYNVIQWVQRSSRGWSYGGGVSDPRTGEMIKGHVTLGALRVRQDRMIFESLVGSRESGSGTERDSLLAALARLRQLAAHEVGHTLGLAHNFAASTYGRASVMDYPAPLVDLVPKSEGFGLELSFAEAYGVGVGAWDLFTIRQLYADLGADGEEQRGDWVSDAHARGLLYLSDADARPAGAADPRGNLWDNGADAIEGLRQVLEVRRLGLEEFGTRCLVEGEPTALLEERLIPLFFLHRYQTIAAAKYLGGRTYQHALAGDGRMPHEIVNAGEQRRALDALLGALRSTLELPPVVLEQLAPGTVISGRRRELFDGRSAPFFDENGLAEGAAHLVLSNILVPERLERLVQQNSRDANQLGLEEVLARLVELCLFADSAQGHVTKAVLQHALVDELLDLAADPGASPHVRAVIESTLATTVTTWGAQRANKSADERALSRRIQRFLERDSEWPATRSKRRVLPPGSPIGCSRG